MIREQHRSRKQGVEENRTQRIVVRQIDDQFRVHVGKPIHVGLAGGSTSSRMIRRALTVTRRANHACSSSHRCVPLREMDRKMQRCSVRDMDRKMLRRSNSAICAGFPWVFQRNREASIKTNLEQVAYFI
ncbi:MAG: hypothetical protein P4M07_09870 [Xanthobacteraceae bacterium]|nr:hypothetical protein [Xanthobacteraceae bacterium]